MKRIVAMLLLTLFVAAFIAGCGADKSGPMRAEVKKQIDMVIQQTGKFAGMIKMAPKKTREEMYKKICDRINSDSRFGEMRTSEENYLKDGLKKLLGL